MTTRASEFSAHTFRLSLIHVSYQDQKYPMHTANLGWDFSIPFPESFDQYLSGGLSYSFGSQASGSGHLGGNSDQIDGMVWPEATSAFYLSSVLQQLANPGSPTATDRNMLSGAVTTHTINVLSGNWKRGDRTAAVGTNFMYTSLPLTPSPIIHNLASLGDFISNPYACF